MMRRAALLPAGPTRYRGPRPPLQLLAALNVLGTARSLVHILAPDSGAASSRVN